MQAATSSTSLPRVRAIPDNRSQGEDFNFSAILDDYTIVKELGQGGFGKVLLGKHKEEKKEVVKEVSKKS